jgi:hypothetical protein
MKRFVVGLAITFSGAALACGTGNDLRTTGANKAAASLMSMRTLWENVQSNATNAQSAMIELARLPGGLAAVLLKPIDLPLATSGKATSTAAASFPGCTVLGNEAACETATFTSCEASGITLNGSGRRCEASSCSGGRVYNATLNLSLNAGGGTGSLGVELKDACVTPTTAGGKITANVALNFPSIPATNMTLTAVVSNVAIAAGSPIPTTGEILVKGTGTFVGGSIEGCARVSWSGTNVTVAVLGMAACSGL